MGGVGQPSRRSSVFYVTAMAFIINEEIFQGTQAITLESTSRTDAR